MPPSKTSIPGDAAQVSCFIPPSESSSVALCGGTPTRAPFPFPHGADAGADAANSTNHHRQIFSQFLLPDPSIPKLLCQLEDRQHKEGTFSQSSAPGAHSPADEQFPHPWAGAGQDLQAWQGAGAGCAEHRDVTNARMGRSRRARSPWGFFFFHPQFCCLPCPHLQIFPQSHSTRALAGQSWAPLAATGTHQEQLHPWELRAWG